MYEIKYGQKSKQSRKSLHNWHRFDNGHSISEVAQLSPDQLDTRLKELSGLQGSSERVHAEKLRCWVIGERFASRFEDWYALSGRPIAIVHKQRSVEEALRIKISPSEIDALLVL